MKNEELAWKISEYMIASGYYYPNAFKYNLALDWLNLCCNICQISIDPGRYDEGLLYCESAWDYAQNQSRFLEEMNVELIRFLYAWNAVECIANEMISSDGQLRETTREICLFLKRKGIISQLPPSFWNFRKKYILKIQSSYEMNDIISQIKNPDTADFHLKEYTKEFMDDAGELFFIVSKIRNKFAHGRFHMLNYDEEFEDELSTEKNIILLSTQIVLLTIVMLLCIESIDLDLKIYEYPTLIDLEKGMPAKDFLLSLFDSPEE